MAVVSGLMAGLTLLVVPAAEAQSTSPYTTLNIGVGSDPHGVAVDGTTDTVYAANYGSDTLSVIDGATNTVAATIGVGSRPMPSRSTRRLTSRMWPTPARTQCR